MINFKYLNEYTLGDSVTILKEIPDQSVDLIFTSPAELSQTDFGKNVSKHQQWLEGIMDEFARIVKPKGFIVLSQQDRKVNGTIYPIHWWYNKWLSERGMVLKDEKILIRNRAERVDLYRFTYQYFNCFTKDGKIPASKRKGRWLQDIIVDPEVSVANQYIWSLDFCNLVIETLTEPGDFVIDPFAGYAPVLYSAKTLNRNFWGGELDPKRYNKDFEYYTGHARVSYN